MDINKYLTIIRYKNGKIKITHDLRNEANIYRSLYDLGFRKTIINKKQVLFKYTENDLIPVSIDDIRYTFYNVIRDSKFENIPQDINKDDILNWYLNERPIRQNGLFNDLLNEELGEITTHALRLKIDFEYKHNFTINSTIEKLKKWNFRKTTDEKSAICTNATLYYKKVDTNKFLIFTHFNTKSKQAIDGFDCYLANFTDEKEIGKKSPKELKKIKLSFNLEQDYNLIKNYIEFTKTPSTSSC